MWTSITARSVCCLHGWRSRWPGCRRIPPKKVHELRLRTGCGICLSIAGQQTTLDELPECPQTLRGRTLDALQMDEILYVLCGGSVHTHQAELAQGYLTTASGCRVGVGGRFVLRGPEDVVLQRLFVAEFPHCASNLYGTSGGAVHPFAGTFHRGTVGGRTGQRQDHPSAADRPGTGCTETGRGCDRRARGTFFRRSGRMAMPLTASAACPKAVRSRWRCGRWLRR